MPQNSGGVRNPSKSHHETHTQKDPKKADRKIKPPSLTEIETILRQRREELNREYNVAEIGVFGSYVRSEATDKSDIDILVEFSCPVGFFKFLQLEDRLSELLGARVDLVTKAALKPHIGRHILNEVTMI